ncbi:MULTISPECIES: hypothetical protein [unclassified Streptomyces]
MSGIQPSSRHPYSAPASASTPAAAPSQPGSDHPARSTTSSR